MHLARKEIFNVAMNWLLIGFPMLIGAIVASFGLWFAYRRKRVGDLSVEIGKIKLSTKTLAIAMFIVALLFFGFALLAFSQTEEYELAKQKIQLQRQELETTREEARFRRALLSSARTMSDNQRASLFLAMAGQMRNELRNIGPKLRSVGVDAALSSIEAQAGFLREFDPNNGHGLYFTGEAMRIRGERDMFRSIFRQFISIARQHFPSSFTDRSTAEVCYASAQGFCAERIAWIYHLLANDYLRDALDESERSAKKTKLQTALSDAETAIKVWGKPFLQTSKLIVDTESVRARALGALNQNPSGTDH